MVIIVFYYCHGEFTKITVAVFLSPAYGRLLSVEPLSRICGF
jgi:hypothetical protein